MGLYGSARNKPDPGDNPWTMRPWGSLLGKPRLLRSTLSKVGRSVSTGQTEDEKRSPWDGRA